MAFVQINRLYINRDINTINLIRLTTGEVKGGWKAFTNDFC